MNKPTISNSKIIILVAFVSAAIITSLFIYRSTHKQIIPNIADGAVTLFPAARDIKPFELVSHEQAFTQNALKKHWTLLVFGFTHCDNVCPASLNMLAHAYPSLHERIPNLQVVFISLDPEHDDQQTLAKYMQSFHADFIGVSGQLKTLRKLQAQLGVYSELNKSTHLIQHTPSILLINPQGKWTGLFHFGMTPDRFTAAVTDSIQTLNTYG